MAKQPNTERRKYDEEILIAIAEIKKDTGQIFDRLNKINGTVQDYNANKYKMDLACKEIATITDDIEKNIKPPITKLTIKVYSAAVVTGLFSGGIGALIGFYIAKLFAVTVGAS